MTGRLRRPIAALAAGALLFEIVAPAAALALTGGPTQPEFSSFEPVSSSNMVDPFTGAFTYNLPVLNIPGPNGSGYSMSLSYHSGSSAEDEASWVGYGWTLSPGSIIRSKRGLPDDYKGAEVTYWNKTEPNWTVTAGRSIGASEAFSSDFVDVGLELKYSARYNNYQGFGYTNGLGVRAKGLVDVNVGYEETFGEDGTYSFSASPASNLFGAIPGASALLSTPLVGRMMSQTVGMFDNALNDYVAYTFGEYRLPVNFPEYTGESYNYSSGLMIAPSQIPLGPELGQSGSFSEQTNRPTEAVHSFGYIYSGEASGPDDQMDYFVEKESPYNKRDLFLGIPFSNADNFLVSGEGISGGFRAYSSNAGTFKPDRKESGTDIVQISGDLHVGPNIGGGVDLGTGTQRLIMRPLHDPLSGLGYTFPKSGTEPEPYFFRFNNDPGGSIEFTTDDGAINMARSYAWPNKVKPVLEKRSGRSTYIGYRTNRQIAQRSPSGCADMAGWSGSVHYRAHTRDTATRNHVSRTEGNQIADGIGEFAIVKENGQRYIFGLPVYSRNESNLQYGLTGVTVTPDAAEYIVTSRLGVANGAQLPGGARTVVGQQSKTPYASTYLLTQVTTPDYIDRTNDGPTPDDFGGYTKFNYERTAGGGDKAGEGDWYHWRSPYTGLIQDRRSLSDSRRRMGGVSSGEKEVYFLTSIETRTHIALFRTSARLDGFEAAHDAADAAGGQNSPALNPTQHPNKLRKLDRIELYAKNDQGGPGKLLSTVNFEYDYSICRDLPNSAADDNPDFPNTTAGKLTLKRLWFDYEGTHNARVNPYVFGYQYRPAGYYKSEIASGPYADIIQHGSLLTADEQNPKYSVFGIDRWGHYQNDGFARVRALKEWQNQNPSSTFDPAAWQLKWIKLPSGGELQVQYEQNEYSYVQDRAAMAMVSLRELNNATSDVVVDRPRLDWQDASYKYFLDLRELGITSTTPGRAKLVADIVSRMKEVFLQRNEPIYFKFLYGLDGTHDPSTHGSGSCTSEFITGYIDVLDVKVEPDAGGVDQICVELKNPNRDAGGTADHSTSTQTGYCVPQQVARRFVKTSRMGILEADCQPPKRMLGSFEARARVQSLVSTFNSIGNMFPENSCDKFSLKNSYFRIPLPTSVPKKGGGIRVKRLLMYDPGIETGDAALYGTEYIYRNLDGTSSGVATNEPATGREENALVTCLRKRVPQSGYQRMTAGRDKEQFEGPIGESLLPAASVGYARVVSRDISTAVRPSGFVEYLFHTARDFPYDYNYTSGGAIAGRAVSWTDMYADDDNDYFTNGILMMHQASFNRSQGYRFILFNMHGRPMRTTWYGGSPLESEEGVPQRSSTISRSQAYEYYMPWERIRMVHGPGDIRLDFPGREMEVVFEGRSVENVVDNASLEVDFSMGLFFIPIPFPSCFPSFDREDIQLMTHVTSKVIRYPVITKAVTVVEDGVTRRTENVAFNPENGSVAITRATDGYVDNPRTGPLQDNGRYSWIFPAARFYPAMGQKAMREGLILPSRTRSGGTTTTNGSVRFDKGYLLSGNRHFLTARAEATTDGTIGASAIDVARELGLLTPGDIVDVRTGGANPSALGAYRVGRVALNQVELLPMSGSYVTTHLLDPNVTIEIIESARTNQVDAPAGSLSVYGRNPLLSPSMPLYHGLN